MNNVLLWLYAIVSLEIVYVSGVTFLEIFRSYFIKCIVYGITIILCLVFFVIDVIYYFAVNAASISSDYTKQVFWVVHFSLSFFLHTVRYVVYYGHGAVQYYYLIFMNVGVFLRVIYVLNLIFI